MADIQNERDKLLQAAAVRVIPPQPLQINDVIGLPGRLEGIDQHLDAVDGDLDALGSGLSHLMDNSGDVVIRASALAVTASGSVTLTAIRKAGLLGAVTWSVLTGTAALAASGDSCTVSSVATASVTVKAQVGNREAFATIERLGELSKQEQVNAATQIIGFLSSGQVSGLGAMAGLNSVDLNTHTVGALNYGGSKLTGFGALAGQNNVNLGTQATGWLGVGSISGLGSLATQSSVNAATQVTNLGNFAFLNALAANQIAAGTFAVGVQYAGAIYASQITGDILTGVKGIRVNRQAVPGVEAVGLWYNPNNDLGHLSCWGTTWLRYSPTDSRLIIEPTHTWLGSSTTETKIFASHLSLVSTNGITLEGTGLGGNLGSKILLKGVDYTAVIGGVNQTFRIN